MNIKAKIYNKEKELINVFFVIENDRRTNFEKLEKYCGTYNQYNLVKYSIDMLKDWGFNYFNLNGICTYGLETFRVYEFAELKYIIEFAEC